MAKCWALGVLLVVAACDDGLSLSSLGAALPWQPAEATTIVSITLDDGFDSQLLAARILEGDPGTPPEDGFRGTFFVVSGALRRPTDGPGRMTPADVQMLAAAGHEISGHTLTHQSLTELSLVDPYEVRRQVCNDRRALEALGTRPVGFAYPRSADDGVHDVIQDCGYSYARDAGGLTLPSGAGVHAETVPPADRFSIRALPSISAAAAPGDLRHEASKAAVLQDWIEHVRDRGGGWIVITLHHLRAGCGDLGYCMEESELRALVSWLRTRPTGVAVRTMQQVMQGDPLVANPSLEQSSPGASPPRPLCFKRIGLGSNFPAITAPGPGRTGAYAEILRPTASVPGPILQIDPAGRGCALPVVPGRRYEVRAHARALLPSGDAGAASASLVVALQVGGTWQPVTTSSPIAVGGDWTSVAFTTDPVPSGAAAMIFGVQYAGATGTKPDLHVDDLTLVER